MATRPNTSPSLPRPTFPILGLLGLVFVTLKLIPGTVVNTSWSWWWVTAPFWGPLALFAGAVLLGAVAYGISWILWKAIKAWDKRQAKKAEARDD